MSIGEIVLIILKCLALVLMGASLLTDEDSMRIDVRRCLLFFGLVIFFNLVAWR